MPITSGSAAKPEGCGLPLSKAAAEYGRERAARYKGRPEGPREKQEAHKPG